MNTNAASQLTAVHSTVWVVRSALLVLGAFVALSAVDVDLVANTFRLVRSFTSESLGHTQTIIAHSTLLVCVAFALSPAGRMRLGKDTDRPDFSTVSWLSMMFGSGLGIGLIFWSVAEPISHAYSNPFTASMVIDSHGDSNFAVALTMYHWGVYSQSIYGVVAIALGIQTYRKGLPFRLSTILRPVLGRHADGPVGKVAESITLITTVLALSTMLGLGGLALSNSTDSVVSPNAGAAITIAVIALVSYLCVTVRMDRFVRVLSLMGTSLLIIIAVTVLIVGPTEFQLRTMIGAGMRYVTLLPEISFLAPEHSNAMWQDAWSLAYWGWWIAWAPSVGAFYARISKGRTVRALVLAMLTVPTVFCLMWISIMGGGALGLTEDARDSLTQLVVADPSAGLFGLIDALNLGRLEPVLRLATMALIVILGIQSLNASLLGMRLLATGSTRIPKPEALGWVTGIACVAIILLIVGGTTMLQTAAIVGGLLFTLIFVVIVFGLIKTMVQSFESTTL